MAPLALHDVQVLSLVYTVVPSICSELGAVDTYDPGPHVTKLVQPALPPILNLSAAQDSTTVHPEFVVVVVPQFVVVVVTAHVSHSVPAGISTHRFDPAAEY